MSADSLETCLGTLCGWETAIDEKGDVYFWNEETLATTWVRPNVSNM